MMAAEAENENGNGQVLSVVPPGFRFHPTDEELLHYYLKKKVSYEPIDLDVIREVDLNKLEPWDLKEKCKIGSGCQNEWYFFSHKDKKYPTGTRTNRATSAGFWKATGRDKAIHHHHLSNYSNNRIGMRKTLVFYTGRAPHGLKTDWIMHEYRLDDDNSNDHHHHHEVQEEGWVVCRVFKKRNYNRGGGGGGGGYQPGESEVPPPQEQLFVDQTMMTSSFDAPDHHHHQLDPKHNRNNNSQGGGGGGQYYECSIFDGSSMHLPQLLNPEPPRAVVNNNASSSFLSPFCFNSMDIECSRNLLRLTADGSSVCGGGVGGGLIIPHSETETSGSSSTRFNSDWSFLDKLLASQYNHHHHHHSSQSVIDYIPMNPSIHQRFPPIQYGSQTDIFKFSK